MSEAGGRIANGATVQVLVLTIVLTTVLAMGVYASRYKRVPPNKAMVVYGRRPGFRGKPYLVITGGGKFIQPIVEAYEFLSLEPFVVEIDVDRIIADVRENARMVRAHITAKAKISDEVDEVSAAAHHLLGKSVEELRRITGATLEGHLRGILASEPWGVPDFHVSKRTQELAEADLRRIGLVLIGEVSVRQEDPIVDVPAGVSAQQVREAFTALALRVQVIEERLGIARKPEE